MTSILQIAASNQGGGNENKAMRIHEELRRRGIVSCLALGRMAPTNAPGLLQIPNRWDVSRWAQCVLRLRQAFQRVVHDRGHNRLDLFWEALAFPQAAWNNLAGREDFVQPGSHLLSDMVPVNIDAVIIHNVHARWNRHEGFFDLRLLQRLSRTYPVFLIPADMWLLTGHCAHSFACSRWRIGCGHCPDLGIYPSIRRDSTAQNWKRKRAIYAGSSLYVATPSRWLGDLFAESGIEWTGLRSIANGVDPAVYYPGPSDASRAALNLAIDRRIILVSGNAIRTNPWKGFSWVVEAAQMLAENPSAPQVDFLCVGDDAESLDFGKTRVVFAGRVASSNVMAEYYRAADVYFHPSRADTAPFSVLEAMSSGLPVVATAIGGIPEQVEDGRSGFLAPPGNVRLLADCLTQLLTHPDQAREMGEYGRRRVLAHFTFTRQMEEILGWISEIAGKATIND